MYTQHPRSERDLSRDQLLKRMSDAGEGGNPKEVTRALTDAKSWLSENHVGDNSVRKAQFRLLRSFPPIH